jgi:hypothetical protein
VYPSEVYQLLNQIEGVDFVADVALNGLAVDQPLSLRSNELPYLQCNRLRVVPFEERRNNPSQARVGSAPQCPSGECDD